jgi:hypothetical protein
MNDSNEQARSQKFTAGGGANLGNGGQINFRQPQRAAVADLAGGGQNRTAGGAEPPLATPWLRAWQ